MGVRLSYNFTQVARLAQEIYDNSTQEITRKEEQEPDLLSQVAVLFAVNKVDHQSHDHPGKSY